MIKKLDKLIIRAFTGPFLATFLISLFVLVMQFFWLYIDDLVGKGLDISTILLLISFVAATAVPLALPLALLLSSIMTFGNLGESFELIAIKSAGIPLLRFMRPLFIISVFISGIAFLFANNIIPVANLKLDSLKYDIIVAKPAFDIKEGIFYDKISGYVIKIGSKEKNDSIIHNVVLYEKSYGLQDHFMVAKSGVMQVTPDKRFLRFTLRDGWNYQENGDRFTTNTEFIRLGFKEYKKDFDLSDFQMDRTEDSLFKYNPKMLTVGQLSMSIDSLQKPEKELLSRSNRELKTYIPFLRYADSVWPGNNNMTLIPAKATITMKPEKSVKSAIESALRKRNRAYDFAEIMEESTVDPMNALIPDSLRLIVTDRAFAEINAVKSLVEMGATDFNARELLIRKHWIEFNRKFTLSVACIVLFMIGAPLGSIIRKGGLGTPLVFAIVFFVIFHLLNTFGEKFANGGITSPFAGMWLSTLVLIPIGIFLTSKAMSDSQLFNKEFYSRVLKKVGTYIGSLNKIKSPK